MVRFSKDEIAMYAQWYQVPHDFVRGVVAACQGNRGQLVEVLRSMSGGVGGGSVNSQTQLAASTQQRGGSVAPQRSPRAKSASHAHQPSSSSSVGTVHRRSMGVPNAQASSATAASAVMEPAELQTRDKQQASDAAPPLPRHSSYCSQPVASLSFSATDDRPCDDLPSPSGASGRGQRPPRTPKTTSIVEPLPPALSSPSTSAAMETTETLVHSPDSLELTNPSALLGSLTKSPSHEAHLSSPTQMQQQAQIIPPYDYQLPAASSFKTQSVAVVSEEAATVPHPSTALGVQQWMDASSAWQQPTQPSPPRRSQSRGGSGPAVDTWYQQPQTSRAVTRFGAVEDHALLFAIDEALDAEEEAMYRRLSTLSDTDDGGSLYPGGFSFAAWNAVLMPLTKLERRGRLEIETDERAAGLRLWRTALLRRLEVAMEVVTRSSVDEAMERSLQEAMEHKDRGRLQSLMEVSTDEITRRSQLRRHEWRDRCGMQRAGMTRLATDVARHTPLLVREQQEWSRLLLDELTLRERLTVVVSEKEHRLAVVHHWQEGLGGFYGLMGALSGRPELFALQRRNLLNMEAKFRSYIRRYRTAFLSLLSDAHLSFLVRGGALATVIEPYHRDKVLLDERRERWRVEALGVWHLRCVVPLLSSELERRERIVAAEALEMESEIESVAVYERLRLRLRNRLRPPQPAGLTPTSVITVAGVPALSAGVSQPLQSAEASNRHAIEAQWEHRFAPVIESFLRLVAVGMLDMSQCDEFLVLGRP